MNIFEIIIAIFFYFLCLWGFRIVAMVLIGKGIGHAAAEAKKKVLGGIGIGKDDA